ncbi:MAG: MoaD/ThiS family protein [Anaerolineae bacterium]
MLVNVMCLGLPVRIPSRVAVDFMSDAEVTVRSLIEVYLSRYDPRIAGALLDVSGLKQGFAILLNGRNVQQFGGLDAAIRDGDLVVITAEVGGG